MEETEVVLIGFADSQGATATNLALSVERARSVGEYLRGNGVTQIEALGLGEVMPVGDNSLESGRTANRRVEVWLRKKGS